METALTYLVLGILVGLVLFVITDYIRYERRWREWKHDNRYHIIGGEEDDNA